MHGSSSVLQSDLSSSRVPFESPPSKERPGFSLVCALLLCDSASYVKDHKPLDLYTRKNTHRDITTLPAVLALSGWGHAELRLDEVLGIPLWLRQVPKLLLLRPCHRELPTMVGSTEIENQCLLMSSQEKASTTSSK
jgi:hypothetical protein